MDKQRAYKWAKLWAESREYDDELIDFLEEDAKDFIDFLEDNDQEIVEKNESTDTTR